MIRHLVTFRFTDGMTAGAIAAISCALGALPARIPALREYSFGPDLGLAAANGHYAITAVVDDEAGLAAYMEHPDHVRVARELIDPYASAVLAVQIVVPRSAQWGG
ncbi:Dabb family protein [Pseudonocardia sp. GCM10023141]|uniref:Dabb family protein n=1 Tax=Pseudonocardia sp. GCM10023141 TaxID=3252653 RepID=UPI00361945FD